MATWEPYIDRLNQLTEHQQSMILSGLVGRFCDNPEFLAELDAALTRRGAPVKDEARAV